VLRQDRFLRRVLAADLRDEEMEPVFAGNARRVYGLPLLPAAVPPPTEPLR
jgi:hypothetical protein